MNIFEEAIQTRRKFHSRPEEGWTEFETSYLVADRLKTLGWKVASQSWKSIAMLKYT